MENDEGKIMGKRGRLEESPIPEHEQNNHNIKRKKIANELNIQTRILEDPICGLHYYRYLFNRLKIALQNLKVEFDDWETFSGNFILTQEISDEWQSVASKIDMIQVSENITKIITAIKNLNETTSPDDKLNDNYFDLLRKEFIEFFDNDTKFGLSSHHEIKDEPLYVEDDTIILESSKNALKWTAKEKDIFYESLARYGINRIDEIAHFLPQKSPVDIINLYNILKKELKRYKNDRKLRSKLLSFDEMPKAFEVSEEYIKQEEQQASIIESMDDEKFGEMHIQPTSEMKCALVDFACLERKFNIKIGSEAADKIITATINYTKELVWQLYKKKLSEMTPAIFYEWHNQLKAWETPPDPRSFVHVINLRDMTTVPDEEIDFDNVDMTDYNDNENCYFPKFTEAELLMKEDDVIANTVEIPDQIDVLGLGISSEEVDQVAKKFLSSRKLITRTKLTEPEELEEPVSSLFVAEESENEFDSPLLDNLTDTDDSTERENFNETLTNLLSDVENIDDLKTHTDAFEDLELDDSHYSQMFYENNFILPFDEDYTVCGNEYLQKLLENETERLDALDSKDSELYELLLLVTLKQMEDSDRNKILEIISNIDDDILHPLQKNRVNIDERHSKKFMHLYNDY